MNDMLLLTEASCEQMKIVMDYLNKSYRASSQKVSIAKTKMYVSHNISNSLELTLSMTFGFGLTKDLGRYLSVSLLHGHVTKDIYINI